MQFNLKVLSVLFLFLILASGVYACTINIDNLVTEVRANDSYDTSITALKNSDIDIKVDFDIDSFSGSSCPSNITTKVKIYKYDNTNEEWVLMETQSKSNTLSEDNFSVLFSNEFNTGSNSRYTQFKVEGIVLNGTQELDSAEATVDVENNSCDEINLIASSFSINEGSTSTKTVTIENNTGLDFRITNADFSSSSSLIKSGDVEYSNEYVDAHSDELIDLIIQTGYVTSNSSTTIVLSVEGYLGNTYCSASAIGKKNISVTVNNTSSNNTDNTSTSSDCDNIDIQTRSIEFDESTNQKLVFGIKNNSTKRFEVLAVESYSSSFTLSNYFNEKYIFSGQTGELILNAQLPSVSQNRILQGTVKIRGVFSDGRSCSFTQIGTKTFDVSVIDSANNSLNPNCSGFNISVPDSIVIENYGELAFTITNNTNTTATTIIEGSIDVSPTIIVLPRNSSLTRKISVSLNSQTGFVKFVPTIEGCGASTKTVQITNNASGNLSEATINVSANRDYDLSTITLRVQINNPTNKLFNGVLNIDAPNGWPDIEKNVTIVPGENIFIEKIGSSGNYSEGNINVSFSSNGQEISSSVSTNDSSDISLMGLFAFGGNFGLFGILLLILLVIIVVAGILGYSPNNKATTDQKWVNEKD
jgi:hypothetical protein